MPATRERRWRQAAVRKTYKMFVGGAFLRSESGRTVRGRGRRTSPARRARTCATPSSRPREARSPGWARATAYNRGQILYRLAEMMEARSAPTSREVCTGDAREVDARDRSRRLLRGLDRQARAGARRRRTRSRGRTSTSPCPSRWASSPSCPRRAGAARARLAHPARARRRQHGGRGRSERTRSRRSSSPRRSPPPTCRRRREHPHRAAGRARPVAGRATWT